MFIDSHQHFWKYNPLRDKWIDNSMDILKKDYMPKDLEPLVNQNNIQGTIAIQASQSLEETKFLLKLTDTHHFIKGVVGWIDLLSENCNPQLENFTQHLKFKGLRHILQTEPTGFIKKKSFLKNIGLLEKYNLTYDILIYHTQLEEAIQLAKQFPNQTFILDHLGKPNIKNQTLDVWKKNIKSLSNLPNVSCKISGMVTEANWNKWTYHQLEPYMQIALNSFGTERLMFGSNWPVCLLSSNYNDVLSIILKFIASLSVNEQEKIVGRNAIKIYNL